MNEISSRTETKTEEIIIETDDGHGNIVETVTTVTRTYLYITVNHKTAEDMANQYGFNEDQREQLAELLAEENRSMWSSVLYGIYTEDDEIVSVALSQVGNVGGEPYWSWYGFSSRVEWCACFVSWAANECGYIDAGIIPKFAGCIQGSNWFKERGLWQDGSFTPSAGQIIFFDWEGDGLTDHVGIVERVENGTVYTVEGNSGDECPAEQLPHRQQRDLWLRLSGLLKKCKRIPEVYYSSGSFALHIALAVPSIIVSSLSPNVSRIESICRRKVVFSVCLSENMYWSTDISNIVTRRINNGKLGYCPSFSIDCICLGATSRISANCSLVISFASRAFLMACPNAIKSNVSLIHSPPMLVRIDISIIQRR